MGEDIEARKKIIAAEFRMDWWGTMSVRGLRGTGYSNQNRIW